MDYKLPALYKLFYSKNISRHVIDSIILDYIMIPKTTVLNNYDLVKRQFHYKHIIMPLIIENFAKKVVRTHYKYVKHEFHYRYHVLPLI